MNWKKHCQVYWQVCWQIYGADFARIVARTIARSIHLLVRRHSLPVGFLLSLLLLSALPSGTQAASLKDIQNRGYLIVGVKDNLRPLGFRDAQAQLQGFEIDIARQLATELLGDRQAVVFKPLLNQERLEALLNGEVDLVVAHLSVTDARTRLVEFSPPYYIDGTALITNDAAIQGIPDLQQGRVAVLTGSDTIATLRSLLPALPLQGVESYVEAKRLLETGQVDAFAADAVVLTGWVQEDPQYSFISPLISAEALAIAMPKGRAYRQLRAQVNQSVEQWLNNGWLIRRVSSWGLLMDGYPKFVD